VQGSNSTENLRKQVSSVTIGAVLSGKAKWLARCARSKQPDGILVFGPVNLADIALDYFAVEDAAARHMVRTHGGAGVLVDFEQIGGDESCSLKAKGQPTSSGEEFNIDGVSSFRSG
jgi:hypothetical protein